MEYSKDIEFARIKDEYDPLKAFRSKFFIPLHNGRKAIYFCGNSLGLQPQKTIQYLQTELNDWATYAVEGHFKGENPWLSYHKILTPALARLMGAQEQEVVCMGSLTANLHLLLVSFYKPEGKRRKILIEGNAFPSDRYAVLSQLRHHGLSEEDLIEVSPNENGIIPQEIFERTLDLYSDEIATVILGGVNYTSGQVFPLKSITQKAKAIGATVGFDLAHAAGNVPLRLHEWGVDFAAWCSYKYMNSGPGGVAGIFVHEKHLNDSSIDRFEGWWGNDESNRFLMEKEFNPSKTAEAWQLSNAPVLSMAAHKASLDIFEEAGIEKLREKSILLTGYLEFLLKEHLGNSITIITPQNPEERGAQLSLKIDGQGKELVDSLLKKGVYIDFREPDIFRVSPVPLYNTFTEVHQFVTSLLEEL